MIIEIGTRKSFTKAEQVVEYLKKGDYTLKEVDGNYIIEVDISQPAKRKRKFDEIKELVHHKYVHYIQICYFYFLGSIIHDCQQCNKRSLAQYMKQVEEILEIMNEAISTMGKEKSREDTSTPIDDSEEQVS